jgi:hypothetical protein
MERVLLGVCIRRADYVRRALRASSWPITEKEPT